MARALTEQQRRPQWLGGRGRGHRLKFASERSSSQSSQAASGEALYTQKSPARAGTRRRGKEGAPEGGGHEIQARPPSQHDKRHGCSRRTFAPKKAPPHLRPSRDEKSARKGEISTRAASFHWMASKGTIVAGSRLFRSRGRTAILGARQRSRTWIPKFQRLNALFNWLDPDKRHQLTI